MSLRIELVFAWGYSIKAKKVAKNQHAHPLPPPTTLIGAISKSLAITTGRGEIIELDGKLASQAKTYAPIFKYASAFLESGEGASLGKYWEDPLRYQILQFQKQSRRKDPTYRFGLIPAGKVYCPSAKLVAGYLVDENTASRILGKEWVTRLIKAAYTITHVGSKESIVAVDKADLNEAKHLDDGEFTTRFYLPRKAGDIISVEPIMYGLQGTYVENFWEIGYDWGAEQEDVEYIVPGLRDPLVSCRIRFKPKAGYISYMVGEDGVTIPA